MNDRGAEERGFGTPPVEENGERRDEAATPAVPAAVHIEGRGGSASVKGCTAKDRWGERHGEEDDYGEKGRGRGNRVGSRSRNLENRRGALGFHLEGG